MEDINNRIADTFREISNTSLWDENLPFSLEEYEQLITTEETNKLLEMIETEDSDAIANVTLDELLQLSFKSAEEIIGHFMLAKRIKVLNDLEMRRSYLYSQASRYGAEKSTDSDCLTTREWNIIISKIKHLEIIQAWLYGI